MSERICEGAAYDRPKLKVFDGKILLTGCCNLSATQRERLNQHLESVGIQAIAESTDETSIPLQISQSGQTINMARLLAPIFTTAAQDPIPEAGLNQGYRRGLTRGVKIDFAEVREKTSRLASLIRARTRELTSVLLRYETHSVALDEINRTLDLLENIDENKEFFIQKVGRAVTFLPKNQPLYAFCLFAIVPSLLCESINLRIPTLMRGFFEEMVEVLELKRHDFLNIHIVRDGREDFIARSREIDPELVIFTGTTTNADRLRRNFRRNALYIANGAGHNPLVITEEADIDAAVLSAARVQLYNQGQDCASPSAILVQKKHLQAFLDGLIERIQAVPAGPYDDPRSIIGPLTDLADIPRVQKLLLENREWIHPQTDGVIRARTGVVEPTVVVRPLEKGGNYTEQFAPIFFVHPYERDEDLGKYFEDHRYEYHAMYISLFGRSPYIDRLLERKYSDGRPFHDESTILRETDLHSPGVERGVKPYGGYGRGASWIVHGDRTSPQPILIPRDVNRHLLGI